MTINISPSLKKKIINFCDDELNYHINETGCPDEYEEEIEAQIELLYLLGESEMAAEYEEQFNEAMKEFEDDYDDDEDDDEDY